MCIYLLKFELLPYPDAMNYAAIAREINQGNGFTTKQIRPLSLFFEDRFHNHPSLDRPPLYPLLIAMSQRVLGPSGEASLAVNALAYSLIAPSIYILGRILFSRIVALVASVIAIFNVEMIEMSLGLTEPIYTLLFITMLIAIIKDRFIAAGVLLGASYLTHFSTPFLIPGAILMIVLKKDCHRERVKTTSITLLAAFLIVSPWLIRNFIITGNPFFSLQKYEIAMFTETYPGREIYSLFEPISITKYILHNPVEMGSKIIWGMDSLFHSIPRLFENWIYIPLAGIGMYTSKSKGGKVLLAGLFCMIGTQYIALSAISTLERLFIRYIPVVILFSALGTITLIDRVDFNQLSGQKYIPNVGRKQVIISIIFILILPNLFTLVQLDPTPNYIIEEQNAFSDIKSETPEQAVIISNTPWSVSWHSDRVSVYVPAHRSEINNKLSEVEYIYLSPSFGNPSGTVKTSPIREDFTIIEQYDSGAMLLKRK